MSAPTLHPDGSRSLTLPDGRVVGWREFGAPDGSPVLFLHGWPGSSAQGVYLHRHALERGLRIIAPDRPAIGRSTSIPERRFLDFPPLAAGLMDALGCGRFSIFGVSGGGPYALACAWALGARIRAVLDCCGAPPLDTPGARRQLSPIYQFMLGVRDHAPVLLRAMLEAGTWVGSIPPPWPLMRLLLMTVPPRDREALASRDRFHEFFPSFHGAMRSGGSALWEDGCRYAEPWDFAVEGIRVPVRVWHGRFDRNFHWSLAADLAARIPGARFRLVDEGHYSLPAFSGAAMLDDLLDAAV